MSDLLRRRLVIVGVTLLALGLLVGLVAAWWWALAGMTREVGGAAGLTALTLVFVGGLVAASGATP